MALRLPDATATAQAATPSVVQVIVNMVPQNPFASAAQGGADLLPLPYSIESRQRRQHALALQRATRNLPHTRIITGPNKSVRAIGELPVERPLSAGRLIGAITVLLLELMPYLALVNEFLPSKRAPKNAA